MNTGWLVISLVFISGLGALIFSFLSLKWIERQDTGDKNILEISDNIAQGAMAFLRREYTILSIFIVVVAILLFASNSGDLKWISASFILGAICSATAGYVGMVSATKSNVRTTVAAQKGLTEALSIAFKGGAVMGITVVGLALIGLSICMSFLMCKYGTGVNSLKDTVLPILSGFSLGASSIALFARVGGGIFTKAADVGADLVGKVEMGIPEDSPNNPATIADNVGDNVGDVAGMGADLFESYFGAILGCMVLAATLKTGSDAETIKLIFLPLAIAVVGILISIIATSWVKVKEGGSPQKALDGGTFAAAGLTALISLPLCLIMAPKNFGEGYSNIGLFFATIAGLASGVLIGKITEYYTATEKKPVESIAKSCETGAATNIITGIAVGMRSCSWPILCIVVCIIIANALAGLFGIALAALGMLATTGIQLAVDAYGPIADNAGGLAEMAGLPSEVRERTDKLDAVGNTTAAIGKGFAIGSAALTALALFSAFKESVGLQSIDITNPLVICGLFIGGVTPFIFSAMAMEAVGRAAFSMIGEVRRQFREIPGLLKGEGKADYASCVDIATQAALREMVMPGILAISTPIIAAYIGGSEMLGGVLAGVTVCGVLMALFMSNSGGAWDNAKKTIESGKYGGRNSDAHAAAVIGDTVGDPFKDTAGPALNILVKLMCVVSLALAPVIKNITPLLQKWL